MKELDEMFSVYENTMSLHLRDKLQPLVKHGRPGEWSLEPISDEFLTRDYLESLANLIFDQVSDDDNAFIETEDDLVQVIQLRDYRIVITIPPFSNAYEITVVRPTIQKNLESYNLNPQLLERLKDRAEGILIAGAPGHGKSTFAAALTNFYAKQDKIIKTIEKPRDLQLNEDVTQFTTLPKDVEKLGDILLLLRPDYIIFDEIRKNLDFSVYTDLRLAGVGMVGVIHATKPIDAIQRFVNRVELGLIPNIIDTIIFIFNGELDTVLNIKMTVKTPSGFNDQGLARPVIEVRDFNTHRPLYEMFSFGEQIVVIPIGGYKPPRRSKYNKKSRKSKKRNKKRFYSKNDFDNSSNDIPDIVETKKEITLIIGDEFSNYEIQIMVGPQILMNAVVNDYGEVTVSKKKSVGKKLVKMLRSADSPLSFKVI